SRKDSVTLVGFGTFLQRHRGARTGKNPQTGEPVKIKASVEGQGADIKALCHDAEGQLLGYALTGAAVMVKLALNKALPALLA
ncbi:HU family DNA-binding protein, partial [Pseudomonas viridiflava]|uniref:HU family DNA-binding protein n=1 Tax=Pseudomonas viridiflava TaxID=33069 RepID=UPI001F142C36